MLDRGWPGRGHPWLATVLVTGMIVRAILVPITHGPDFIVWDLASRATLDGVNIYANHPPYPGGPFAYFPLFLYLELPMQWLTQHLGIPFTVMGKLPIVAGDVLAATVLAVETRRRGHDDRGQAVAAGLFFLNPLVLYNGAFYGRFDSVALGLLVLAGVACHRRATAPWRLPLSYALSVAAKTFPIFVLPWFLRRDRITAVRLLTTCIVVLCLITAPYLLTSPHAFVADLLYSTDKLAGGLSWQVALHERLPESTQLLLGGALLCIFAVTAVALSFIDDFDAYCAVTILAFLVLSKYVLEQYLTWPIPFLALLVVDARLCSAAWMLGLLTIAGMVVNPYAHPFGEQPALLNIVLAAAMLVAAVRIVATASGRSRPPDPAGRRDPPAVSSDSR